MPASNRGESLIGSLDDPLAADVDPTARRHLAVHHQAEGFQTAELFPIGPMPDQIGICDQDAGRVLVSLEDAGRLSRLHQKGLVVFQFAESRYDRMVGLPVARRFAAPAVDDQVLRPFGDLCVQVVHQHAQRGFLVPALAA